MDEFPLVRPRFRRNIELPELWTQFDDRELTDPHRLQRLIEEQIGLRLNTRTLQLTAEVQSLWGGLQCKQYPGELAGLLAWIGARAAEIDSYLEIGVERGGTYFVIDSYLRRMNPHFRGSLGIDVCRKIEQHGLAEYQRHFPNCRFQCIDAAEWTPEDRYTLCLIDGDHRAAGVRRDLARVRPHVRYVAFHDIAARLPGVEVHVVWNEVQSQAPAWEFHAQDARFPVPLGIGVIDVGVPATDSGGSSAVVMDQTV